MKQSREKLLTNNIMKNKKLNLGDLKVKSFVTEMENNSDQTVKGGYRTQYPIICSEGDVCSILCSDSFCENYCP